MSAEFSPSCDTCTAACCGRRSQNMYIDLSPEEAKLVDSQGTGLVKNPRRGMWPPSEGYERFEFVEMDCPQLDRETFLCRIYENRPRVCRSFEVGCNSCLWTYTSRET